MTYSNPSLEVLIEDYPIGSGRRGQCRFWVESDPKRGMRVGKQTFGKPKYTTYSYRAAIVTGDDNRTYVLRDCRQYGFIDVARHDFKNAESVFKHDERYPALLALIDSVQPQV